MVIASRIWKAVTFTSVDGYFFFLAMHSCMHDRLSMRKIKEMQTDPLPRNDLPMDHLRLD